MKTFLIAALLSAALGSLLISCGDNRSGAEKATANDTNPQPKEAKGRQPTNDSQAMVTIDGQVTITLKGHTGRVRSVAFSPDGKRLVSASDEDKPGELKMWDVTTGQAILTLKGQSDSFGVALSPDGKQLAIVSNDYDKPGELRVLDASNGQLLLALKGHTKGVSAGVFSPDGKWLV